MGEANLSGRSQTKHGLNRRLLVQTGVPSAYEPAAPLPADQAG